MLSGSSSTSIDLMTQFVVILSFLVSLLISNYLVPILIKLAKRLKIMDYPDGALKSHKSPTPYLGGIGVYLGFIGSLAIVYPIENKIFLLLVGSTILLFVGLIDDLIKLTPLQKFLGQITAALCFLKAGYYLKENFFSYIPNIIISFFWILTVINAFNLIDVMDGLATTVAIFATVSFLISSMLLENYNVAILLAAFLGALVGFLRYNWPVAKIYLGDTGSLLIGGLLANVAFMLPWSCYNPTGFILPIIILMIPLLEIGTLIIVRTYKKIPFYNGSPDHFSIYLQRNGWKKQYILYYVIFISLVLSFLSNLFILNNIPLYLLLLLTLLITILWYILLFIKKF